MPIGFTQTAFMQDQTEQTLLAELAELASRLTITISLATSTSPPMTPGAPY